MDGNVNSVLMNTPFSNTFKTLEITETEAGICDLSFQHNREVLRFVFKVAVDFLPLTRRFHCAVVQKLSAFETIRW